MESHHKWSPLGPCLPWPPCSFAPCQARVIVPATFCCRVAHQCATPPLSEPPSSPHGSPPVDCDCSVILLAHHPDSALTPILLDRQNCYVSIIYRMMFGWRCIVYCHRGNLSPSLFPLVAQRICLNSVILKPSPRIAVSFHPLVSCVGHTVNVLVLVL